MTDPIDHSTVPDGPGRNAPPDGGRASGDDAPAEMVYTAGGGTRTEPADVGPARVGAADDRRASITRAMAPHAGRSRHGDAPDAANDRRGATAEYADDDRDEDDRDEDDRDENEDDHDAEDGARRLWNGDTGALDFDTRRVLVQLLAGPSLDAERHRLLWPVLLRDEAVLRSRLAELFLELLVDPDLGVAFVRQVETEELDIPILLRRQQLTFVDSVVLLHLRQLLIRAQSAGERAVVSTTEIVDAAGVYARSDSTDHAGFARRVAASVEKLKKASLLRKLRGSDERFEIAPTLKLLFSAERVEALIGEYRRLGGAPDEGTSSDPASGTRPGPSAGAS